MKITRLRVSPRHGGEKEFDENYSVPDLFRSGLLDCAVLQKEEAKYHSFHNLPSANLLVSATIISLT